MKPISLDLQNFRSLNRFKYSFKPGTTGVKGPNYAGKSNFSDLGIRFALLGLTPSGYTKKDLITWGETQGATTAVFEAGGKKYTITRSLHSARQSLEIDGEEDVTDPSAIKERLEDVIGVSLPLISEYCFIPQFQLTDILEMRKSNRLEYFLRIVGGDRAEKIQDVLLAEGINKVPVYPDRSEEITQLEDDIENSKTSLSAINKKLKNVSESLEQAIKQQDNISHRQHKKLNTEIEQEIKKEKEKLNKAEEDLKDLRGEDLPENPGRITDEMRDRKKWLEEGEKEYIRTKEELNNLVIPEKPNSDPEAEKDTLLKIQADYNKIKSELELVKQGKCPTCGRDFEKAEEKIKILTDKMDGIKSDFNELKAQYEKHKEEHNEYNEATRRIEIKKTELNSNLKSLEASKSDLDMTLEAIKDLEEARNKYDEALERHRKVQTETDELKSKISSAKTRIELLEKTETVTQEELDELGRVKQIVKDLTSEERQIQDNKIRLESEIKSKNKSLEGYRLEADKREEMEREKGFLTQARNIFHRTSLPSLVLEDRRQFLNKCLKEYLDGLDSGFTACLDQEFDFRCSFENGEADRPIKDLSGGQRVMFAIVFHLAKLRLLPQVPFLVLDEPTMYLNRSVISDVSRLFSKFCRENGKDTYIIIPTHESELDAGFDRIFNFNATGDA